MNKITLQGLIIKKIKIIILIGLLSSGVINADKLEDIQKQQTIKIGTQQNVYPFGFTNNDGKIIGFDIDMMEAIAKQLGVMAKFIPLESKNYIESILKNKIDVVAASIIHRVDSEKIIDFSIDYFYDGQAMLGKNGSTARSYKDFIGKKVGVIENSKNGKVFEVVQPLSELVNFKNYDDALHALEKGTIDVITGEFSALSIMAQKSGGEFTIIGKTFTIEPYAIGLKENESNLRDEINIAIQKMVKNGEYDRLYKKWFGQSPIQKPILWP